MDGAPSSSRTRKRWRGKEAATTPAAVEGTVRERQGRRRSLRQAKKEGNCLGQAENQVYLSPGISYYGPPVHECQYCGAQFWHQERVKRSYSGEGGCIRFHLCCRGGKVILPFQRDPPQFLARLLDPHGDVLSKFF